MKTEPLTVEELERKSVESLIRSLCLNGERGGKTPAEMRYLIREWAQSHSRQLWLEAAEEIDDYKRAIIRTGAVPNDRSVQSALDFMANRFRTKAESTPKPSPALPTKEKL